MEANSEQPANYVPLPDFVERMVTATRLQMSRAAINPNAVPAGRAWHYFVDMQIVDGRERGLPPLAIEQFAELHNDQLLAEQFRQLWEIAVKRSVDKLDTPGTQEPAPPHHPPAPVGAEPVSPGSLHSRN